MNTASHRKTLMPFVVNSVKLHLNDYILITKLNMKHHIDINIEY